MAKIKWPSTLPFVIAMGFLLYLILSTVVEAVRP